MRLALRRRFRWLAALVVVVAVCVGVAGSLRYRALEAHEIFVAQTSRQMMAADGGKGDWVRPVFNDRPRLNKPPLMYWCVIGAAKVLPGAGDVQPWVARLPSAFASGVMALCAVLMGWALVNRSVGVLAGVAGVGSMGWVTYANNARPEMLYGTLCVVMVTCFVWAWRLGRARAGSLPAGRGAMWLVAGGWVAGGLAVLAKGPHIPLLLVLGMCVFALVERRRGLIRGLGLWWGVPLMLAVPLPWVVALLLREPGGWEAWTRDLFAGRAGSRASLGDWLKPYYLYSIPGLLLPWGVLLVWGVKRAFARVDGAWRAERWGLRLVFWMCVVAGLVMSLTIHRRDYYLLSLMPGLAVVCAEVVWSWWIGRGRGLAWGGRWRRWGLGVTAACVGGAAFGLAAWPTVWGGRRVRMDTFARACAAAVEPGSRVVAFGEDPTFLVYARNGVVPKVDDPAEVRRLIEAGEVEAVLTNDQWWAKVGWGGNVRELVRNDGGKHADESAVLFGVGR